MSDYEFLDALITLVRAYHKVDDETLDIAKDYVTNMEREHLAEFIEDITKLSIKG